MAVLECFGADHAVLALKDIARNVGLPKSTTCRIVRTLEELGYVVRLENGQFCLSLRVCKLATVADVRAVSRREMECLANRLQETITLCTLIDGKRERLDVVNKAWPLRRPLRACERGPLSASATSLVLMAFADEKKRDAVLPSALRASGLSRRMMEDMLHEVHERGYAISHSAATPGLSAIAVPVQSFVKDRTYSIAVTGLSTRVSSRAPDITRYALDAAKRISLRLGGPIHQHGG